MRICGNYLRNVRVLQSDAVPDVCLVRAEVYRTCKGRSESTGETLSGSVRAEDVLEWAFINGLLNWRDDPRNRSELQEMRH